MIYIPSTTSASRKYNEKAYDRMQITFKKGKKAEIQQFASAQNKSLNSFINEAVDEKMERDAKKADE